MTNSSKLSVELQQFHGTEHYYQHQMGLIHFTDGIKYLAENAGAYWLIDIVASYQVDHKVKQESFQVFELKVDTDKSATITITDGNDNILRVQELEYTDFPLSEITVWCVDKIMLLPGEY